MGSSALFLAVFLACAVEAVEATTIVLAAGSARDWRSALYGVGFGLLVLAAAVAALGPAVSALPIDVLRLVVGGLLLSFGLQWLRKAILRATGRKSLHDEAAIYRREVAEARSAGTGRQVLAISDWYAFTLSSKGILLEGMEVVLIVITFGANQGRLWLACLAAAAAVVLVTAVAVIVRAPLARVPENTVKFTVGVLLTGFGLFWSTEGAGAHWPGSDSALLWLVPSVAVIALALVAVNTPRPELVR